MFLQWAPLRTRSCKQENDPFLLPMTFTKVPSVPYSVLFAALTQQIRHSGGLSLINTRIAINSCNIVTFNRKTFYYQRNPELQKMTTDLYKHPFNPERKPAEKHRINKKPLAVTTASIINKIFYFTRCNSV
jgi:hypothetical protein